MFVRIVNYLVLSARIRLLIVLNVKVIIYSITPRAFNTALLNIKKIILLDSVF